MGPLSPDHCYLASADLWPMTHMAVMVIFCELLGGLLEITIHLIAEGCVSVFSWRLFCNGYFQRNDRSEVKFSPYLSVYQAVSFVCSLNSVVLY